MGVREQRLAWLGPEPLFGRCAPQETAEAGVGAADQAPRRLEISVTAGDDQQIGDLVERIPIGEGELEHRVGSVQNIRGPGHDIKALPRS